MVQEQANTDGSRQRRARVSKGHNPPVVVDEEIPTYETGIQVVGGPGKPFPRAAGSWPWTAGSFTLGSNKVWNLFYVDIQSSSANMHWLLRHSHPGTNVIPGGTLQDWWHNAAGGIRIVQDAQSPIRSIRGPGTIFLYGVGGRKNATGSVPFKALPTDGTSNFTAVLRGFVE